MSRRVTLSQQAQRYLRERRRLGFQLRSMGHALRSFTRYMDQLKPCRPVTLELMAQWARQDRGHSTDPRTWAQRLKILRPFTRWLQQFEPSTEVPDDTVFGPIGERVAPHIFTEQELAELVRAAGQLSPELRGATYSTLFALIASTGLRVSEAVRLNNADVDLKAGVLTVRCTKFAKSRHVPLHSSAIEPLRRYRRLRDRWVTPTADSPFFVGSRGRRRGEQLSTHQVDRVFASFRSQLRWRNRGAHHAPRVHDLRHSFVVHRILAWQSQGIDIDQAMLSLSTYVGHAMVTNTYWYLTAIPELMAIAGRKFESRMAPGARHA
jgi:integrase